MLVAERVRWKGYYALAISVACPLGLLMAAQPRAIAAVTIVALIAVFALRSLRFAVCACVFAGLAALPIQVPQTISVGSSVLYTFEPLLLLVGVHVLRSLLFLSAGSKSWLVLIWLGVAMGVAVGAVRGADWDRVVFDCRGVVDLALVATLSGEVRARVGDRWLLGCLHACLWVSAVVTLAAALGFRASGRTETASLYLSGGEVAASSSVRVMTPSTHLSLLVMCCGLVLVASGRARWLVVWPYVVPASIVVFLSFSRNSILGLTIAVVLSMTCWWSVETTRRVVLGVIAVITAFLVSSLMVNTVAPEPVRHWVVNQASGYSSRVIEGLVGESAEQDTSVLYRDREKVYLLRAINAAPLTGHGFGFAYKPAIESAGVFGSGNGRWYAHNFYLWTWVKTGLFGLLGWLMAVASLGRRCYRGRESISGATALSGLAVLSAICWVAPLPISPESGGPLVVGLVLGLAGGIGKVGSGVKREGEL